LAIKRWVCIKTAHLERKVIVLEVVELKATDVVQTIGREKTGVVKWDYIQTYTQKRNV